MAKAQAPPDNDNGPYPGPWYVQAGWRFLEKQGVAVALLAVFVWAAVFKYGPDLMASYKDFLDRSAKTMETNSQTMREMHDTMESIDETLLDISAVEQQTIGFMDMVNQDHANHDAAVKADHAQQAEDIRVVKDGVETLLSRP